MQKIEFIGRYRVVRRIGSGAFADVFLAVDEDLESPVAVKVLAERWALDADIRERFLNEARLLRRIGGSRLVGVHDIGQTPAGRPYFVMPYADRGTLEDRLAAGPGIPQAAALAVAREVALALRRVHEAGVVHRDVKPGNILIFSGERAEIDPQTAGSDAGGRAGSGAGERAGTGSVGAPLLGQDERLVLGDLGLAKDLSVRASGLSLPMGTPGYMAPEQSDAGAPVDQRADVYACSALLTRILVGRPPGAGAPDELADAVGPAVLRSILAGLEPLPGARPASVADWLDSLDTAVAADRSARRRTGLASWSRRRLEAGRWRTVTAAAAVVVVASLAGVALSFHERESPRAAPPAIRYEEVFDDTRSISVRVPAGWSQRWGNGWHPGQSPFYGKVNVGPGLNASPNVSDWFSDAAVPGLFAGASARVVREGRFSPDYMRQYFGPAGCEADGSSEWRLDRLGLTGVQGRWTCPGGTRWRFAYGWPAHHRYVLALEIKLVAPDNQAWDEALNSVTVHTEPPNG